MAEVNVLIWVEMSTKRVRGSWMGSNGSMSSEMERSRCRCGGSGRGEGEWRIGQEDAEHARRGAQPANFIWATPPNQRNAGTRFSVLNKGPYCAC